MLFVLICIRPTDMKNQVNFCVSVSILKALLNSFIKIVTNTFDLAKIGKLCRNSLAG